MFNQKKHCNKSKAYDFYSCKKQLNLQRICFFESVYNAQQHKKCLINCINNQQRSIYATSITRVSEKLTKLQQPNMRFLYTSASIDLFSGCNFGFWLFVQHADQLRNALLPHCAAKGLKEATATKAQLRLFPT